MLFDRIGCRALLSAAVGIGVGVGAAGGLGTTNSHAASLVPPAASAGSVTVRVQSAPSAPGGTASSEAGKEPQTPPKPKSKEKQRRLSPCGPGLAPCGTTK